MSRTYDFIADLARREMPPPARFLDFGCGRGQVVTKALALGYDAHGTDLFAGGWREQYGASAAALGDRLRPMRSPTQIPFGDASFDVAATNQVFEHIANKPALIAELARVLRPAGVLIAIFPTREVIVEPHLRAPFVHRFRQGSQAQKMALGLCHRLGFATREPAGRDAWVNSAVDDLAANMFYIADRSVPDIFGPAFTLIRQGEPDFMRDRLATSRLMALAQLGNNGAMNAMLRFLCLRLANGVYVFSRR